MIRFCKLSALFLLAGNCDGFSNPKKSFGVQRQECGVFVQMQNTDDCSDNSNNNNNNNNNSRRSSVAGEACSRRRWLKDTVGIIAGSVVASGIPGQARAAVYLDPDRYGDKELKIATVNKLRQNVRDSILKTPSIAPLFVKVAVQDALTYNAKSEEGGPDGTIVSAILNGESSGLSELKVAAEELVQIRKKIKRTTEVTMADVVAFAGAEAIESAGGPRIPIQLGKMDPDPTVSKKRTSSPVIYADLCSSKAGKDVLDAFANAGLSEREVALIYGALGSMESVSTAFKKDDDNFEENEMGDVDIFIPSSFGSPQEMFGSRLGQMDNSAFKDVAADIKKKKSPSVDVFRDDKVGQWAVKYAGNNNGFLKDLPEAYTKIMALGGRYTGGKVGSLLGSGETDF